MRRRIVLATTLVAALGWLATTAWHPTRAWPLVAQTSPTNEACPVTAPATEPPPYEQDGRPGWWHSSPDGEIWVLIPPGRTAGGPVKTPWYRPAGAALEVTGHRLDGEAPPLVYEEPPDSITYERRSFMPSGLGFPVAGCWEIVPRPGGSELRAVVEILPRFYRSPVANCQDLYGVVASSDAVALVTVEGTTPDRPGWAWQTVRPELVWKGDVPLGGLGGGSIDALQETAIEPVLRPEGRYVIFLQSRPGHPCRIVCDGLTVAEVEGERVIHRPGAIGGHPVWIGETLADLDRQLATFTGAGWALFPAATPGS